MAYRIETGYKPQPKQMELHSTLANEVLFGGAAGPGKLLPLDAILPTPHGWITIGDVRSGTTLFDEQGNTCSVVRLFKVVEAPVLFRLTFDDGSSVDCCEDHEWLTLDAKELAALTRRDPTWREQRRNKRESRRKENTSDKKYQSLLKHNSNISPESLSPPTGTIRTTREIIGTLHVGTRSNHAIPISKPIDMPSRPLPLDPYVLGVWLGDGSKNSSQITGVDDAIWGEIEGAGLKVTHHKNKKSHGVAGLTTLLRGIGVLTDKHVPAQYLRADKNARLSLLQGILDTDGTVDKRDGGPSFCNTNKRLVSDVYELVVSLGWKAFVTEGRARLYGKDCGPKWTILFKPDEYVFRLPRKRNIQKLASRRTTRFRYIVKAEPIPTRPGRCIEVDSPSHLYLTGAAMVPTHNSHALRHEGLDWCLRIPGLQVYLFRRTFPELEKNHILTSLSEFPMEAGQYKDQKRRWEFTNGSMLHFCHCQYEKDVFNYQGAEIHLLLIDELTTFTEFQYDYLRGRVRTTLMIPEKYRCRIPGVVCASNPGGVGHEFAKRRWVDYVKPGEVRKAIPREGGMIRAYIPGLLEDNPILLERDPGYMHRLDALPEPFRTAYRLGNWDIFLGQAFHFSKEFHVINPLPIPQGAPLYSTFDWGFGAPFSWGWWWVDADGRGFRFAEFYGWNGTPNKGLRWEDSKIADEIVLRERALEEQYGISFRNIIRKAGPDCFQKKPDYKGGGQGPSTAEVFAGKGIIMSPGDPRRDLKIRQFRERLKIPRSADGTPTGLPMMMVYSTCEQFIRTIPLLQTHPLKIEDIDTTGEDHIYDEAAHFAMARPIALREAPPIKLQSDRRIDFTEQPLTLGQESWERYAYENQKEETKFWNQYIEEQFFGDAPSRGGTYSDIDGR